jgi:hypothetical protein
VGLGSQPRSQGRSKRRTARTKTGDEGIPTMHESPCGSESASGSSRHGVFVHSKLSKSTGNATVPLQAELCTIDVAPQRPFQQKYSFTLRKFRLLQVGAILVFYLIRLNYDLFSTLAGMQKILSSHVVAVVQCEPNTERSTDRSSEFLHRSILGAIEVVHEVAHCGLPGFQPVNALDRADQSVYLIHSVPLTSKRPESASLLTSWVQ